MKKFISIILLFSLVISSVTISSPTVYAATAIPKAYISNSWQYGNGHKITISLTQSTTTPVEVWYRTQDGSAVSQSTVASKSRFFDAKSGYVRFEPGQTSKTVTVYGYDPDSYEESSRFYNFQIYSVNGNATIDKNRDLQLLWHSEHPNNVVGEKLHYDGNDYHYMMKIYEDSGRYPLYDSGNSHSYSTKKWEWEDTGAPGYWLRIGVTEFDTWMYGHVWTDDSDIKLYFDIKNSWESNYHSDGYYVRKDGDGWNDDGSNKHVVGPRRINKSTYIRPLAKVYDAGGSDYATSEHVAIFGQPHDSDTPDIHDINVSTDNYYGAGQEILIAIIFDEIVRVADTNATSLRILDDNGTERAATYYGGSGTDTLVYKFVVPHGAYATKLRLASNPFWGEAQVTDVRGNKFEDSSFTSKLGSSKIISYYVDYDGRAPKIIGGPVQTKGSDYIDSGRVRFKVKFDKSVRILGDPRITLSNGGMAIAENPNYNSTEHFFYYDVTSFGDVSNYPYPLNITGFASGAKIYDLRDNECSTSLSGTPIDNFNLILDDIKPVVDVVYETDYNSPAQSHTIKVTATDLLSGINTNNEFKYGLSLGSYGNSGQLGIAREIVADNPTQVYISVVDQAGNVQQVETETLIMDQAEPMIMFDYGSGIPQSTGNIDVTIEDEGGGMKDTVSYKWFNEGKSVVEQGNKSGFTGKLPTTKSFTYSPLSSGLYSLWVSATDLAENQIDDTSNQIFIDKTKPTVTVYPETKNANKSSYNIVISGEDQNGNYPNGEVSQISYRWEGSQGNTNWTNINDSTVSFSYDNDGDSGERILRVKVKDSAGTSGEENELEETFTFTFDHDGPIIQGTSTGFNSTVNNIDIDINTSDDLNSVEEVKYAIRDNDNQNVSGSDWTTLVGNNGTVNKNTDNGDFYLHVKAIDSEGNTSYYVSPVFTMDNEATLGTLSIDGEYTNTEIITLNMSLDSSSESGIQFCLSEDDTNYTDYEDFVESTTYTISDTSEGQKTIYMKLKDSSGNISEPITDTIIFDQTPPTCEIDYSITTRTRNNVVASVINISDNYSASSNVTVDHVSQSFDDNGSKTFALTDEAGNQLFIAAEVTWMDLVKPTVTFEPNGDIAYTKSKNITLSAIKSGDTVTGQYRLLNEALEPVSSYIDFSNEDMITINNEKPVIVEVKAVDSIGNEKIEKSNVYNTDNLPPVAQIAYSTTRRTASDVIATISFDEFTTVTNNNGSKSYRFSENGNFTFEFVDQAGNRGSMLAVVDNIDRTAPVADVSLSTTDITNQSVEITISVESLINAGIGEAEFITQTSSVAISPIATKTRIAEGQTVVYEAKYLINENGKISANIFDLVTDVEDVTEMMVVNIDKTEPDFNYIVEPSSPTRGTVAAIITYSDAMSMPVTIVSEPVSPIDGKYVFNENGEYTFELKDALGNQGVYTVSITNVDREIVPQVKYDISTFTNTDVVATVYSDDEEVFASNNLESTSYTFLENGTFEFEVYDEAGNTGTAIAEVDWIDKIGCSFTVEPSTKEKTNQPIIMTFEPASQVAKISTSAGVELIPGEINKVKAFKIGKYDFDVTDLYGNVKRLTYYIGNVDTTAPVLDYELGLNTGKGRIIVAEGEPISTSCSSVRIDFSDEEKYTFTSYDPRLEYDEGDHAFVVKDNDTYTFVAEDIAGNTSSKTITITGIDTSGPPDVTIVYSETENTKDNVIASVQCDEEILVMNNYNNPNYLFTENGTFIFVVCDLAGNMVEVTARVENIDKKPPLIKIDYSETETTNKDITVALKSDEKFYVVKDSDIQVEVGNSYDYTFEYNHAAYFKVKDVAGNEDIVYIEIDYIDKVAPNILFRTDKPIVISQGDEDFDFMKGVYADSTDLDRIEVDKDAVKFNKVGKYTAVFTAYDLVGNQKSVNKDVEIIDANQPLIVRNNGTDPDVTDYIVGDSIDLDIYNIHDYEMVYYLPKRTNITEVKQVGILLEGDVIEVEKSSWYSILVIDKDYNKKFYQIFIAK